MKNILIIDDDPVVHNLLSDALKKEGYEVFISREGSSYSDRITKDKPDLILLDIIMPDLNGFQILEEIKNKSSAPGIPIIILSSFFEKDSVKKAMDLGAEDYWLKSDFTISQLVEKIKKIINR